MTAPVTIVGSGLAGALLACYLGRRGWRVALYERRGDPRRGYPGGQVRGQRGPRVYQGRAHRAQIQQQPLLIAQLLGGVIGQGEGTLQPATPPVPQQNIGSVWEQLSARSVVPEGGEHDDRLQFWVGVLREEFSHHASKNGFRDLEARSHVREGRGP